MLEIEITSLIIIPIFGKGIGDLKYATTVPSLSHHTSVFDIRLEYFVFSSKLVWKTHIAVVWL